MVKKMLVFSLKKDTDPDKFWKFWIEKHSAAFKKVPGLKKYVLNRAIRVEKGKERFYGIAEIWFDTEADYDKAMKFRETQPDKGNFSDFVEGAYTQWVEEKVITP